MAIHKDLGLAYVVFELESFIGVYSIDAKTGLLEQVELVPLMPEPSNVDYAAEIELSPHGHHLYVSNRGTGAMVVFQILARGPCPADMSTNSCHLENNC